MIQATMRVKLSGIDPRIRIFRQKIVAMAGMTAAILIVAQCCFAADAVGKWKRFSVAYRNSTCQGDPFDVEFKGHFISPTGRQLTQWGFYAGNETWKIYFMPDETGDWTFETVSPDEDLNGRQGSFRCIASDLPGPLIPVKNRWKLQDGGYDFPVIWENVKPDQWWYFRINPVSDPYVMESLDFAKNTVGARLLVPGCYALALPATSGWFDGVGDRRAFASPYVSGSWDQFHFAFWDELNAKCDAVRDMEMGFYIMIYSDDDEAPPFGPGSPEEMRLLRYTIARLACYPILFWDDGIDITEFRSDEWTAWFEKWFRENDPWRHPVSSRNGSKANATYWSDGQVDLPSRSLLLENDRNRSLPTVYTDHWRPYIGRGNWNQTNLRTGIWRALLTGGQGAYIDCNSGCNAERFPESREIGRQVGYATRFFRDRLRGGFADLEPHDDLIASASSGAIGDTIILAANPSFEYVLYTQTGGEIGLDLTDLSGSGKVEWLNPRTGEFTDAGRVEGGAERTFPTPTAVAGEDWVLHIRAIH